MKDLIKIALSGFIILSLFPIPLSFSEPPSMTSQLLDKRIILMRHRIKNDEEQGYLSHKDAHKYKAKLNILDSEIQQARMKNELTPEVTDLIDYELTHLSEELSDKERQPIQHHIEHIEQHIAP